MKLREFSPEVIADLWDIWSYIAKDDPLAADRLEDEILNACRKLVQNPCLGHARSDLTAKALRFWPVHRNYLIIYRIDGEMLDIVRIFHASRDMGTEL